jgi:hypothetical protein
VGYRPTRVEPEVPVGLWEEPDAVAVLEPEAEPDAEDTAVAARLFVSPWSMGSSSLLSVLAPLAMDSSLPPSAYLTIATGTKLTDLNIGVVANLRKRTHSSLGILTADLSDLGAQVLGLAHSLDVHGILVLVHGAEKAAGGSGDGELREGEEGSGENSTAKHFGCGVEERRFE